MRKIRLLLVIPCVLLAALVCVSCSQPQIITATETAITAVEIALPLVSTAAGIPPATLNMILDYLQSASVGLDKVATILAVGGTQTYVAEQITLALAGTINQDPVILAQIGPLGGAIVQAIQAITKDLESILLQYGTPITAPNAPRKAASGGHVYHFQGADMVRIEAARARTEALRARIAAIRK
jgi:hypothetical protein